MFFWLFSWSYWKLDQWLSLHWKVITRKLSLWQLNNFSVSISFKFMSILMLVMSEGLMHFGYEKIQVLYCILVKMWSKKSSKSRKCSLHVQQNRIFFPVDTNPLNGMVRDVSVTDLKGGKNEIAGRLCPSTGQLASQREVLPFIQVSAQMFNNLPSHIQLSHSNTWRCLWENRFVGFPKHYFNKTLATTNWPLKSRAMCAGGGN